jgi:hypothetical protein
MYFYNFLLRLVIYYHISNMSSMLKIPICLFLIDLFQDKGNVCLGLLNGTEINHGSTIIVGDVSLRGKLVVYDNERRQIGWANSECSKPQSQKGFPFL